VTRVTALDRPHTFDALTWNRGLTNSRAGLAFCVNSIFCEASYSTCAHALMESGKPAECGQPIDNCELGDCVTWMSNLLVRHSYPILIISGSILGIDLILFISGSIHGIELIGRFLYAL
jgi:hypothetical protein